MSSVQNQNASSRVELLPSLLHLPVWEVEILLRKISNLHCCRSHKSTIFVLHKSIDQGLAQIQNTWQVKYLWPLTVPSFLPVGSSYWIPTHIPGWNLVTPTNLGSRRNIGGRKRNSETQKLRNSGSEERTKSAEVKEESRMSDEFRRKSEVQEKIRNQELSNNLGGN